VSLKTRILRLERRQGLHAVIPPIEFFDRIVSGSASEEEWKHWGPWLIRTLNLPPDLQEASKSDEGCNRERGGAPDG
jgi:hypothetical protein